MSLKCVKLKYEEIEALLYFEGSNTSLEKLSLVSNKLDAGSIAAVAKQITIKPLVWPLLNYLDLSYNVIDISSMQILTNGIANCHSIKTLILAGCSLQANTVHVLNVHLTTNSHVKEINLAFNSLGAMGAMSIATVIELNSCITSINLRRNGIGYQGGIAISEALRSNYMMKQLCLVDNAVGEEAMAQISGRLRSTLKDVVKSVRAAETDLPPWYDEDRFSDWKPRLSNVLLAGGGGGGDGLGEEEGEGGSGGRFDEEWSGEEEEDNGSGSGGLNGMYSRDGEDPATATATDSMDSNANGDRGNDRNDRGRGNDRNNRNNRNNDDDRMVVFTDSTDRPEGGMRLPPNMPPIPMKKG